MLISAGWETACAKEPALKGGSRQEPGGDHSSLVTGEGAFNVPYRCVTKGGHWPNVLPLGIPSRAVSFFSGPHDSQVHFS